MNKITPRTIGFGIGFFLAWIIGAVLVETIYLPTPIYAILVVGFEIASFISFGIDIVRDPEYVY